MNFIEVPANSAVDDATQMVNTARADQRHERIVKVLVVPSFKLDCNALSIEPKSMKAFVINNRGGSQLVFSCTIETEEPKMWSLIGSNRTIAPLDQAKVIVHRHVSE